MDQDLVGQWKDAARRADEVRHRIAKLARAGVPVSRALLVELARCQAEVAARLQAVRDADIPYNPH